MRYHRLRGVIDSSVGYTGGRTANPTYESVCAGDGHTEALRLIFDPKVTSYAEIIREFYSDPHVSNQFCSDDSGGGRSGMEKPQYRTAVWAQDEQQRLTALAVSREVGKEIPVLSHTPWYDAEAYHQHWMDPLARPCHWKTAEEPEAPKALISSDPWAWHGSIDADA